MFRAAQKHCDPLPQLEAHASVGAGSSKIVYFLGWLYRYRRFVATIYAQQCQHFFLKLRSSSTKFDILAGAQKKRVLQRMSWTSLSSDLLMQDQIDFSIHT